MKWAGIKHILVSPEDPESYSLAENFMKVVKKVLLTSHIEKKNFKAELFKSLRHYRATPHSSTGRHHQKSCSIEKYAHVSQSISSQHMTHSCEHSMTNRRPPKSTTKMPSPMSSRTTFSFGDKVLLLQKESKTQIRYDSIHARSPRSKEANHSHISTEVTPWTDTERIKVNSLGQDVPLCQPLSLLLSPPQPSYPTCGTAHPTDSTSSYRTKPDPNGRTYHCTS